MNKKELAYLRGFSKTAEAYGVDPVVLAKQAQVFRAGVEGLARLLGKSWGKMKRVGQLVGGGNEATRKAVEGHRAGAKDVNNWLKTTLEGHRSAGTLTKDVMKDLYTQRMNKMQNLYSTHISDAAKKELQKVFAARTGVATAGTLGTYGLGKAIFGGDNSKAN